MESLTEWLDAIAVLCSIAGVSKAINHTLGTPVIDSSATLVTDSTRLAFVQDLFHPVLISGGA